MWGDADEKYVALFVCALRPSPDHRSLALRNL